MTGSATLMVTLRTLILSENTEQLSAPIVNVKHKHKGNLCFLKSLESQLQHWGNHSCKYNLHSMFVTIGLRQAEKTRNFPVPLEFIAMESDLFFFFATSWINSYVGIKIMAFEYLTSGHNWIFPAGISWGFGTFSQNTGILYLYKGQLLSSLQSHQTPE